MNFCETLQPILDHRSIGHLDMGVWLWGLRGLNNPLLTEIFEIEYGLELEGAASSVG
jgi:hypothetical protein